MGFLSKIFDPKATILAQKEKGIREETNLLFVLIFAFVNYFAQLPELYRNFQNGPQTVLNDEGKTVALDFAYIAGWQAVFSITILPLLLYLIAALVHYIMKRFGGKASWKEARRALFWSCLVALFLVVLTGLLPVFGFAQHADILGIITLAFFLWYFVTSLKALEFPDV